MSGTRYSTTMGSSRDSLSTCVVSRGVTRREREDGGEDIYQLGRQGRECSTPGAQGPAASKLPRTHARTTEGDSAVALVNEVR